MPQDKNMIQVKGEIQASFYDQSKLQAWQKKLNKNILRFRKHLPRLMLFYQLGELRKIDKHNNVICNAGFNAITKLLSGDTTYSGEINKALLGDGSGSVDASDTQLINEVYRNDIASGTDDDSVVYLTAFFTETEVAGTFTEFGNCIDGGASANTGQLWSHISGLNWFKDNNVVLVVSCKYTFSSL